MLNFQSEARQEPDWIENIGRVWRRKSILIVSTYSTNAVGHPDIGHFQGFHMGVLFQGIQQVFQDLSLDLSDIVDINTD